MVAPGDKIFPFFHSFQQELEGMTRNSKNGVNNFSEKTVLFAEGGTDLFFFSNSLLTIGKES